MSVIVLNGADHPVPVSSTIPIKSCHLCMNIEFYEAPTGLLPTYHTRTGPTMRLQDSDLETQRVLVTLKYHPVFNTDAGGVPSTWYTTRYCVGFLPVGVAAPSTFADFGLVVTNHSGFTPFSTQRTPAVLATSPVTITAQPYYASIGIGLGTNPPFVDSFEIDLPETEPGAAVYNVFFVYLEQGTAHITNVGNVDIQVTCV